jgi:hypothetical protein
MKRSFTVPRCVRCYAMLVDILCDDGRITQACPRCFKVRLVDVVRQLHELEPS